jgi:MFS family permease
MQEQWGADLEAVIAVLQTALTPAFLLVAVGSLLNVLTGRLSRIVDRSRDLEERHPKAKGADRVQLVLEMRILQRRMHVVGFSILMSVLSAVVVCIMIGLLFLMGLSHFSMAALIVASFILGLLLLSASLIAFVWEVRLSTHAIRIRKELLELDEG